MILAQATTTTPAPDNIPDTLSQWVGYIIIFMLSGGLFAISKSIYTTVKNLREGKIQQKRDLLDINGQATTAAISVLKSQMETQSEWYHSQVAQLSERVKDLQVRERRLEAVIDCYGDLLRKHGIPIPSETEGMMDDHEQEKSE